jgi:amidophosphoribosyltransferase
MQEIHIPIATEINSPKHCMFEFIYFANPVSNIDNRLVHKVRVELGKKLAKQIQSTPDSWDIVVPVPDTSRIAAQAIAETLNVPFVEGIIKNRYMHRTFIMENPGMRSEFATQKYLYIKELIEGKSVLVVDDSIVRGLTSKLIVRHLFDLGAEQVGFAVTSPPIRNPCYYGVDFSTKKELIASDKSIEQICEWLESTKLYFLSVDELKESIQLSICAACITGDYPTSYGKKLAEMLSNGDLSDSDRHYEQNFIVNKNY